MWRAIISAMLPGRLLGVALLLAAAPAPPGPPAPPLVRYELTETWRWVTPAGERTRSVSGAVSVLGERLRWELSRGSFPGTRARLVVSDERSLALVDEEGNASARVTASDVRGLFVPDGAAEPGLSAARLSDVTASLVREGPGAPFEGRPTVRYALSAGYRLDVSTPGRSVRVKTTCRGSLVVVEEGVPAERTAPDDLLRLVPAREEAREALSSELSRLRGLVVRMRLTVDAERQVAPVAGVPGTPDEPPSKTTTLVTREVSGLSVEPAAPADAARFAVPEKARLVGLERLLTGSASLP